MRTLKEINELVKNGKTDEVTAEEWIILNELVDALMKLMKPVIETMDVMVNQFGQFLELMEGQE